MRLQSKDTTVRERFASGGGPYLAGPAPDYGHAKTQTWGGGREGEDGPEPAGSGE